MEVTDSRIVSENDEYASWTQCICLYRTIIVGFLSPFELVVSGMFDDIIPRTTDREILKLDRDGQQEAAANIFVEALLRSDDKNKWKIFQQEIKKPGHKIIQDILSGDADQYLEEHELHEKVVNVFRETLIGKLDPNETMEKCCSEDLLSQAEYEKVRACNTNSGAHHANILLLSFIHRKKDFYYIFLKIIWDMDQKSLVEDVDPDYFEKLRAQETEGVENRGDQETAMKEPCKQETKESLQGTAMNEVVDQENDLMESEDVQEAVMSNYGPPLSSNNLLNAPDDVERVLHVETEKPLELNDLNETHRKLPQPEDIQEYFDESNVAENLMSNKVEKTVAKDQPFTLRPYQEELARSACQGKNVIICAPTGSGKTHVALQIISDHMPSMRERNSKVMFLVNQKALAEQQLDVLKKHLGVKHKCLQVSGDTELTAPFRKIVQMHDILVVTAQILVDALSHGDVESIRVFSLLIFDECHHTKDKHPFNSIMLRYLREKYPDVQNPQNIQHGMPQIVGLTASVGVGKAKTEDDAVKHIRQLCANLDVAEICIVEEHKEELSQFTNSADHGIFPCQSRNEDEFKKLVDTIMRQIEDKMRQLCENAHMPDFTAQLPSLVKRWSQAYLQWVSKMFKEIARIRDGDLRRKLESARRYLEIYYNSLTINEDCRTEDAFRYLQGKIDAVANDQSDNFTSFEVELHESFERHKTVLETSNRRSNTVNPKLEKLHCLIRQCFDENKDSRAIVFVKTRELATALEYWIRETPYLEKLNPRKMVGAGASAERGGMTQSQQVDVMSCFRDGRHKIIVATSVAQEGLDVTKCNMVIQYDYNTNEIAMVQARGRARAENSQYAVIASQETSVEEKEQFNLMREKLMNDAIYTLKIQMTNDVEGYEKIKTEHQMGSLTTMILEEKSRIQFLQLGEFKLSCARCDHLACFSSDLRTIKDSHHVVIDPEFGNQIMVKVHPRPDSYSGIEKKGKLHCKKCSDDWGIVIKHLGHFYPVIKIQKFCVTDSLHSCKTYKRWKDVNFRIIPLEMNESTYNIDPLCDCLSEQ